MLEDDTKNFIEQMAGLGREHGQSMTKLLSEIAKEMGENCDKAEKDGVGVVVRAAGRGAYFGALNLTLKADDESAFKAILRDES